MKLLKLISTVAIAGVLLAGCKSTGQQALSKGDYYTACVQAIDKLRSSPDNAKAADALAQAYPLAVDYTQREAERLLASPSNNNRFRMLLNLYLQMNNIAVQLSRCPAALKIIPDADYYSSQLESARNRAAEEVYLLAENHLRMGTRPEAREAYRQYQQVNSIIPGYRDVADKLQQAKWDATLKVVLEQIPVEGQYKISADFFQAKVFEYFSTGIRNEFIRVFSPEEAETNGLQPDQRIRLRFLDFVVGQLRESKHTREVTRDSVATGTYKDAKGEEYTVYGTVKAKLTTHTVELSSSGLLEAAIINDASNTVLSQHRFPGAYVWSDSWASFNGDERALSRQELNLCKRSEPSPAPPPQELFVQFTVPIYADLTRFIQNYYRSY
ncbi:MAG: hypothetical protein LBU42_09115 [Prevotellaceae bacterium]|jgi:hypothetical protein|nr:hypothetical protein [Prevotellaceae bacterium]